MSQSTFLEDVICWTREECEQRWTEAVPKLVSCFREAENYHGEIGVLKILCQCFVPCMDLNDLEECLFKEISSKTCDSYSKILEDVKSAVASEVDLIVKETLEGLFELMLDILDCVEGSVKYLTGADNSIELSQVHSLSPLTCHLLKTTFTHCKESGEIYHDWLTSLSEPLSVLFRKAYSLQMAYLCLLDKITVGYNYTEDDVRDLTQVCEGLYRISQLVTSFDIKIAVTLWKAISRHVIQHKLLLRDRMDLASMVIYLCSEINRGYSYLFTMVPDLTSHSQVSNQPVEDKAFLKSVKILGFQMKVLVMLVKEFEGYLADCERPVYILLLHLYKMQPPGLSAPSLQKDHQEEIERQLLNAAEPLITHLLDCDRFITCLTLDDKGVCDDTSLSHLRLQMLALSQIPSLSDGIQEKWLTSHKYPEDEPRTGIVTAIFQSVEKCEIELLLNGQLPGVMCSGKPQRYVSLYEYVCTGLCGFLASTSTLQFHYLEVCLVEQLVSVDPMISQLAMDVWCFITRYGSADLCLSHIKLLCEIVSPSPRSHVTEFYNVLCLIGRLTKFLAPEHQENFEKICPIEKNLVIWSHLPLSELSSNFQTQIVNKLISFCLSSIKTWLETEPKTSSSLTNLCSSLELLLHILASLKDLEVDDLREFEAELTEKYCSLMSTLPDMRDPHNAASSQCLTVICLMINIGGCLVPCFDNNTLLQVLRVWMSLLQDTPFIELHLALCNVLLHSAPLNISPSSQVLRVWMSLLRDTPSIELHLALCNVLLHSAPLNISPSSQQAGIIQVTSDIIRALLSDTRGLVNHSGCIVLSEFISLSPHPSIVEEVLQGQEALHGQEVLQAQLSKYIHKQVDKPDTLQEQIVRLKSQKDSLEQFKSLSIEEQIKTQPKTEVKENPIITDIDNEDILKDLLDTSLEEPAAKKMKLDPVELKMKETELLENTKDIVKQWAEIIQSKSLSQTTLTSLRLVLRDLSDALPLPNENG